MSDKISWQEYENILIDESIDESVVMQYSFIEQGEGKFDWVLKPNPEMVEIPDSKLPEENAIGFANAFSRKRRQSRFRRRMRRNPDTPVLVSEGDSWFQFPLLIKEVIDQLGDDYAIWSVDAAGDTASNMIFGEERKFKTEYMRALRKEKDRVQAFLFSAAGNDIIGEDPETKVSSLFNILKPFNGDEEDVVGHIDFGVLADRLSFLRSGYETVINNIRTEEGLESLPILIHGYDYVFPYPFGDNDKRNPIYAENDEWLGKPLSVRGINSQLGRKIIIVLIDALYDMLRQVAGNSVESRVWVVDCRHNVAKRFRRVLLSTVDKC